MDTTQATANPDPRRRAAERIVRALRDAGHTAYFAGGCVRDMLLGYNPKDYDVATDARPQQVAARFKRTRFVGEAFGVVLVQGPDADVEVATFRAESGYADRRRPDHVQFTTPEHDAQRRDFTINGLFYDPLHQQVIDYVGGQNDLHARRIRAIGNPDQRFAEDYLRMLRAPRFAARLGFDIEPHTRRAIEREAPRLGLISRERIGMEMAQMLAAVTRTRAAELCQNLALDAPALDDAHRTGPLPVLAEMPHDADYPAALAAWAVDRAVNRAPGPARDALDNLPVEPLVQRWRDALCLSNEQRDTLASALKRLPRLLDWPQLSVAARKRLLARHDAPALLNLARAFIRAHGGANLHALEQDIHQLHAQGLNPQPLITGDDLIAEGLKPSPKFKDILEAVYDAQLESRVTTRQAALTLARQLTHHP